MLLLHVLCMYMFGMCGMCGMCAYAGVRAWRVSAMLTV